MADQRRDPGRGEGLTAAPAPRDTNRRRFLPWVAAGAVALLAVGSGLAVTRPWEPVVVALAPDLPPLAVDGTISEAELAHDSRDDLYRTPGGAVPAGTDVTIRVRAAAGDLSGVSVRVYDALADSQVVIPLEVAARDATGGEHGYDYWETTLTTTPEPTVLYYRFIATDGAATRYVEDDALLDGGAGTVLGASADASWQLVTHDPDFSTPTWARGALVYQIFPDRFANGDPSNDPSPDATQGSQGVARYRYGDVYGNPVLPMEWTALPEGHCRAYQEPAAACGSEPLGRDFFGGDLAGITAHLDELAELGVTVLYLNPIFAAPSNHRYDTSDYFIVDPDLGTREDLDALLAAAHERGMRVVLDGVFNHTSSDSPFFDRAHRFTEVGACEAASSPFASWYTLQPGPPAKCFDGQTYVDWFGFDTLPVLDEASPDVFELVNGQGGVVRHWLEAGIDGWRLDVMNEIGHGFLGALRDAAKDANPEAFILGEEWGDASAWLLGTEADSVMNYRFRRAVIGLLNGETPDADGAIAGLTPSDFALTMEGVREDYPAAAWNVLHNLVDSHDTTRILWTLTPGADNREEKEAAAALEAGKARLRLLATLQLTWPGMAGVYYGDEVGLTGHDDPDDRRPYPWDAADAELRDHYATLGTLRQEHEALREGDLRFLLADDDAGALAFGRRTSAEAAVTVLNLSDAERSIEIDVAGYLPDGTRLAPTLGGEALTVADGRVALSLPATSSEVLVSMPGSDLAAPDAPADLAAQTAGTEVVLTWGAVDGANEYAVHRSLVRGGGYLPVGTTTETTFTDRSARPGVRYEYVVTARDAAGNEGARSAPAAALPQVTVTAARIDAPERVEQPLSAVDPGVPIAAVVSVEGRNAIPGRTVGIIAELGFGEPGTSPADGGWTWFPTAFEADADYGDRLIGTVRPEASGKWNVALRVSTDGGQTWAYAGREGIGDVGDALELTATPPTDDEPPAPPRDLVVTTVSDAAIELAWEPSPADDLHRYEILRAPAGGGTEPERIGTATEPTFSDNDVRTGTAYRYLVYAQDTSYNRSAAAEVEAAAESRTVAVTFTVSVPEGTTASPPLHIAGDFQGWDPAATPMTQVDGRTWTITLEFPEGQAIQYKYARGSWEAVEKDAACGEIPNRELTITFGTDGTQAVDDGVGRWRDIHNCG